MSAAARHAALTLAAAVLVALGVTLGVRLLARMLPVPTGPLGLAAIDAGLTLLLFGLLAAVAVLAMRRDGLLAERLGVLSPVWAGLGLTVGIGGLITTFLLATLAGAGARGGGVGTPGLLLVGTIVIAVQAASEELYFRGWMLGALEKAWGCPVALAISAVAFAGLHLLGGARAPLALVNLLLGGLLFGLLAQRTRGLIAPIAAHWGWNWAEGIVFGLDPNPGTGSFGAIWDHDLVGPALWGGSTEGLNASVAMSVVLVALVLPLWASPERSAPLSRSGLRG